MKKIILIIGILVGTLISSNVMCQVIKVNVSETQKFYRYGEFKNPIPIKFLSFTYIYFNYLTHYI